MNPQIIADLLGIPLPEAEALLRRMVAEDTTAEDRAALQTVYRGMLANPGLVTVAEVRRVQRALGVAELPPLPREAGIRTPTVRGPLGFEVPGVTVAPGQNIDTMTLADYQREQTPGIQGPEPTRRFDLRAVAPEAVPIEQRIRDLGVIPTPGRTLNDVALTAAASVGPGELARTVTRSGMNPDDALQVVEARYGPQVLFQPQESLGEKYATARRDPMTGLPTLGGGYLLESGRASEAATRAMGLRPFYQNLTDVGEPIFQARLTAGLAGLNAPAAPPPQLAGLPQAMTATRRRKRPEEEGLPAPTPTSALGTNPNPFGGLLR